MFALEICDCHCKCWSDGKLPPSQSEWHFLYIRWNHVNSMDKDQIIFAGPSIVIFASITGVLSLVMINLVPLASPPDMFLSIMMGHPTNSLRLCKYSTEYNDGCSVPSPLLLLQLLHQHWGKWSCPQNYHPHSWSRFVQLSQAAMQWRLWWGHKWEEASDNHHSWKIMRIF